MDVSYEHANPRHGNESFLIRVEEKHTANIPCLLVDAGDGVDLDSLLDDDEYLAAILLTHAHLDHYQAIDDAHRDGAPILASPGTETILADTFAEGAQQYGLTNTDELLSRVEAIEDWHDVLGDTVRVHPVPAGHTPGACGFLVRIADDDTELRLLVTGDFTTRDAAGFPGFEPNAYPDVDVLFLTAATNHDLEDSLTEIVATVTERTNAGSKTLCTASGLTGVHLATLFAGVDDELDVQIPVVLAGHVAKLYDALDYPHENITTVPEFAATTECFQHGAVTIAGPEVPVEGSSKRLFEAIADDPSATLIQVQGGNTDAKTGSDFAGTISAHTFSNHPPETVLDDVVESVSPTHTIVTHQRGRSLDKYKDKWNSFSWATGSRGRERLYSDGEYLAPPWVSDHVEQRVRNRDGQLDTSRADDALLEAMESIPGLSRRDTIDLDREGVNVDHLRARLHLQSTPESTKPAQTAAPEPTPSDTSDERTAASDGQLYETTGATLTEVPEPTPLEADDEPAASSSTLVDTVQPSIEKQRNMPESQSASETELQPEGDETEQCGESAADEATTESSETPSSESMQTNSTPNQATVSGSTEEQQPSGDTTSIEIDAAVHMLAQRHADADDVSLSAFTRQAIDAYLTALLRDEEPWNDAPAADQSLDLETGPALGELLSIAASEEDVDDVESFVLAHLRDVVGLDSETESLELPEQGSVLDYLDAVVENEATPHDTRRAVVQAALERRVLS